jgi:hypothetical protein
MIMRERAGKIRLPHCFVENRRSAIAKYGLLRATFATVRAFRIGKAPLPLVLYPQRSTVDG